MTIATFGAQLLTTARKHIAKVPSEKVSEFKLKRLTTLNYNCVLCTKAPFLGGAKVYCVLRCFNSKHWCWPAEKKAAN